ncbi:MAG: DJ-1/PfpI family protein [Thermomicrobiales bacterium]
MSSPTAMRIDILVFDGVDELDALAPLRVLRGAAWSGADFTVRLVTRLPRTTVTASTGLTFIPDGVLGDPALPDILIVPGGGWGSRAEVGAWGEAQRGDIPAALAKAAADAPEMILATICTGAMLVAYAGLTAGRRAITHHAALADLAATGTEVIPARVVDDGNLISAGGVASGLDLALWLVERFAGADVALKVERNLEYERRGTVWRG